MLPILQALADERRLDILRRLRGRELSAGRIAEFFELSRPTVSHHLAVLEDAGLVAVRRDGTRRLYSIRPEAFQDLAAFLDQFWEDRLARLKQSAERRGARRSERN